MLLDLIAAFRWCKEEDAVRVAVLTGAGDRAFSAGADLSSFQANAVKPEPPQDRRAFVDLFLLMAGVGKTIVRRIHRPPPPRREGASRPPDTPVAPPPRPLPPPQHTQRGGAPEIPHS